MGEEYQICPHYILNRLFISQNEAFPIQSQRHLFDLTEHQGLSIGLHNQLGMKLSFLYFFRSHWLCIISTWKLFFTKNNIWSLRTTKTCDLCTINTSRKEVASTRLQFTYFAAGYPPCKPSRDHHKMLAAWAAQLHQGDLPNTSPGEWNKHNSQIIDA